MTINSIQSNVNTLHRLPAVIKSTGKPRSTLYRNIKLGLFTKPIKLSERASAWPDREIEALNNARIAGKTDDEIKALVIKLEADRKNGEK